MPTHSSYPDAAVAAVAPTSAMSSATSPAAPSLPDSLAAVVQPLIERHRTVPGGLLPLLHAVQDALGCIPPDAVPAIAQGMGLSRAEVHGVISYYHHFRSEAPGRHVVQVCMAEACQACGADALMADAETLLGCNRHSTRADGAVTLEPVYCLGLCASSPAVAIDERPLARMTPQRLHQLARELGVSA